MNRGGGESENGSTRLLVAGDLNPVDVENLGGSSPFLLLGDHAGRTIPNSLGCLGLKPEDLDRHIAWDIGVAGLGCKLAARLDAVFVHQRYSRLVIDCNRRPGMQSSIPEISDGASIPGNIGLSRHAAAARRDEIFAPYHLQIREIIAERLQRQAPTLLVSLHSFTPRFQGFDRPWRFGVLHRNDSAFSHAVLGRLQEELGEEVGDNEPYAMDGQDFTIPDHADRDGLQYLELEVRQDLLASDEGQAEVAGLAARVLQAAIH